jgi:SAM-dependent MidA family methyltransferase
MSRPPSPLGERIKAQISAGGPITVADYFAMCLLDPRDGYYTTREPFGREGDFTTAPEISQMFGELLAVWVVSAWQGLGRPQPVRLVEIGPGRGTLMADMLRTLAGIAPDFVANASIHLVEASPRLQQVQQEWLKDFDRKISWHDRLEDVPEGPIFLIANELLDALPARQFVKTPSGWRERMVTIGTDGSLAFAAGATGIDPQLLPAGHESAPAGAIFETSPARVAITDAIAYRVARQGGAALLIDYGHLHSGFADTLQALRDHRFDDVLAFPGEADLTSHVDFAPLAAVAEGHGLEALTATQGDFLVGLGLLERAGALGANAAEEIRERLRGEVERLAAPGQMGSLFKVLAITPKGFVPPPWTKPD